MSRIAKIEPTGGLLEAYLEGVCDDAGADAARLARCIVLRALTEGETP